MLKSTKIASFENDHYPLLKKVAKTKKTNDYFNWHAKSQRIKKYCKLCKEKWL